MSCARIKQARVYTRMLRLYFGALMVLGSQLMLRSLHTATTAPLLEALSGQSKRVVHRALRDAIKISTDSQGWT